MSTEPPAGLYVHLPASPSAGGRPSSLFYREAGSGTPLLLLHGGWGYGYYPFEPQMAALGDAFRCLAPDRSGYGRSTPVEEVPLDFHLRAAQEMRLFLDALGIDRALLWGHSDGAVIALHMALADPARFPALVLEALHVYRRKPASRAFFERAAFSPETLGRSVCDRLALHHGDRWRTVVTLNGRAWLRLADEARSPREDLYGGLLAQVRSSVLILQGGKDPRTEPGEMETAVALLPDVRLHLMPEAGHSPHSEGASAVEATAVAAAFLRGHRP